MTTLVTGATGFLGGRLVHRYLEIGRNVTALGRNPDALAALEAAGAQVVQHDLATPFSPEELERLKSIRTIIHCAALSSPFGPKKDFIAGNVIATRTIMDLAEAINVGRFILISTPALYFRTRDQLGLHENDDLPKPINHYAATKHQAELEALSRFGRGLVILRPRGIYGSGDTALLPRLITAARSGPLPLLRGGTAATDITHVDDVVSAILAAEKARASSSRIFNISGGQAINIKDLIDRVMSELGEDVSWRKTPVSLAMAAARLAEIRAGLTGWKREPAITRYSLGLLAYSQTLDIGRAKRKLDWEPKVSLEEGIEEALIPYRQCPLSDDPDDLPREVDRATPLESATAEDTLTEGDPE